MILPFHIERRCLQAAILIGGLVPFLAGGSGLIFGANFLDENIDYGTAMDSHFRYLSALLFGIGLAFWSCIPSPEKNEQRAQLLTAIVFLGGLARLGGAIMTGWPPFFMVLAIGMELIVTPLLYL